MTKRIQEKSWNEFWAYYWRVTRRHEIPGIFEYDRQLVAFIEYVCALTPGARLLDLGCGGGDQAKLFARKGYAMVGIDIAPALVDFARVQFENENLPGTFIAADMRAIDFENEFDACLLLSGTFGFFGDEQDQRLLASIARALKPGGQVFIMLVDINRANKRTRSWSETQDGWQLSETWFDAETSSYRSRTFIVCHDGTLIVPRPEPGYHANETIRCYTMPEMKAMLARVKLSYLASYSSADLSLPPKELVPDVSRNIVVAKKL